MSSGSSRIEQFRQMAEADPDNEVGHFSLGRAYLDAGMAEEAIGPLERAIAINPNLGRVYYLLADAQNRLGQRAEAIVTLTTGLKVATARGEVLTKREMIALMADLGGPVPEEAASSKELKVGEGEVLCSRCGEVKAKLPKPPFKNKQGQLIYDKVCAACWREWIGMGTKVINEMRLSMNEPESQRVFDKYMYEFLNLPQ